jgi:N-acetylmuramoyl-L-alanine amidase
MAIKICLDAGHYGKYNRSKVVPEYYESEMNWKLHNYLAVELEGYGFEVVKTRAELGKDLGLVARGKASVGCDLFLSIHSNACDTESVDYPLVVTMQDGKGDKLGLTIAKKIQELMGTAQAGKIAKKRGTNGGEWYGVLDGADRVGTMGMIIEHSFHTNTKAASWLLNDANLKAMAKAEAEIIAAWFGVEKKEEIEKFVVQLGTYTHQEAKMVVQTLAELGYDPQIAQVSEKPAAVWIPLVGQTVFFRGSRQYSSANSDSPKAAAAGKAQITAIAMGKKHPYHLERTGSTGPWGWVDEGSFGKADA